MNNSLLDDVKALLEKDHGDDRILKQICRACENDEVISNYERNYVRKLAEKYLGRRSEVTQTTTHVEEKPLIPNVVIPETLFAQKPPAFQFTSPRISPSNSKNSKILGVGITALVIIIVATASFSGIFDVTPIDVIPPDVISPVLIADTLSIQTDLSKYAKKDIISISGISNTLGTVSISIVNNNNEPVWTEQVSLKNDGRYSTLAIAGGPGWEISGTYTVNIDNGMETKSNIFSFTA